MLDAIDRYLDLESDERLHYHVGRVMGIYSGVLDVALPRARQKVEETIDRLKNQYKDGLDDVLIQIHDRVMR